MSEKMLSGMGIATLLYAVEDAIDTTKNMRNRSVPFLMALHIYGFDVVQMPGGPIAKEAAQPAIDLPENGE